ncbi:TPA: hypothetical protein HA338_07870 [Methanosarcina acetivorans]|uniref:Uncharacterized protein n=1 Tax=Methanosarcina acetivorans TaxID=2214 RepID=A0A832WA69_9EURY|nr:hypothetical protein [Methanosarcina acetivorans]HIH93950.1 hypothetical protein [Methanosarcina acetivorans]
MDRENLSGKIRYLTGSQGNHSRGADRTFPEIYFPEKRVLFYKKETGGLSTQSIFPVLRHDFGNGG